MRVLQINSVYGVKSTGRTCAETAKALREANHECYSAYGFGKSNEQFTYKIGSNVEYYFHNIMSRITGFQGYFSFFATMRFIRYIKKISPDIIHLRNLHANYLNLPLLFNYLSKANIPVLQYLHDCWAFTGKCAHYTDIQCQKWKKECYNCPVIRQYPQSLFFDRTKHLYNAKKEGYSNIKNLTIVGNSKWTAEQAKMSFFSGRQITYIYNWIDTDIFKPYNDNTLNKFGIDTTKFTIVGVSAAWVPGSPRFEDFIKLSDLLEEDMQLVLVGKSSSKNFPSNIIHIPYVESTLDLAKIYSLGDVFIHLSTEDTFGKVIAEAMACGTPAIVYNSTGCPELIGKDCGYVVEVRDVRGVFDSIKKVKEKGKSHYAKNCIEFVNSNFNYRKNVASLIELYNSILLRKQHMTKTKRVIDHENQG